MSQLTSKTSLGSCAGQSSQPPELGARGGLCLEKGREERPCMLVDTSSRAIVSRITESNMWPLPGLCKSIFAVGYGFGGF